MGASSVVDKVQIKWTQFDEKTQLTNKVAAASDSGLHSVYAFDEKHQLTRRLSGTAKSLDEKFGLSEKFGMVSAKISSNEKVKSMSAKVAKGFNDVVKTVDDVGKETTQLVQEKQLKSEEEEKKEDTVPQVEESEAQPGQQEVAM